LSICGDEVKLAQHMGIPVSRAVDLILGEDAATTDEFLALVDLVLEDNRRGIEIHKDWIERVRERHRTRR
jgi:hypothetical protein